MTRGAFKIGQNNFSIGIDFVIEEYVLLRKVCLLICDSFLAMRWRYNYYMTQIYWKVFLDWIHFLISSFKTDAHLIVVEMLQSTHLLN